MNILSLFYQKKTYYSFIHSFFYNFVLLNKKVDTMIVNPKLKIERLIK